MIRRNVLGLILGVALATPFFCLQASGYFAGSETPTIESIVGLIKSRSGDYRNEEVLKDLEKKVVAIFEAKMSAKEITWFKVKINNEDVLQKKDMDLVVKTWYRSRAYWFEYNEFTLKSPLLVRNTVVFDYFTLNTFSEKTSIY